jgi:transposase-like protein
MVKWRHSRRGKGDDRMTNLLINCYYDGMTVSEAKDFIKRNYKEEASEKAINKAKQKILSTTNKEWK